MNFDKLSSYIDSLQDVGIPYSDLCVHINGESVYRYMRGISDTKNNKKVSENDIYWLYSSTKVLTCIAVMRLFSENKLDIDDAVSKYLPYFKFITVGAKEGRRPPKREVTIRDLMSMKSGLDYDLKTPWIQKALRETNASTQDIAKAISKRAFLFDPGEHFNYSLSHDILGAIIEVSSGEKLYSYLEKTIFTPLNMKSFRFGKNSDCNIVSDQYIYLPFYKKSEKNNKRKYICIIR